MSSEVEKGFGFGCGLAGGVLFVLIAVPLFLLVLALGGCCGGGCALLRHIDTTTAPKPHQYTSPQPPTEPVPPVEPHPEPSPEEVQRQRLEQQAKAKRDKEQADAIAEALKREAEVARKLTEKAQREEKQKRDEEAANAALVFAAGFLKSNDPKTREKGVDRLKSLIDKYPGTKAAKEAAELLKLK